MSDEGGGSLSSLTHLYPLTLCIFSLWPMKHHSSFIQIWDQGTLPPSSLALVSFLEFEVKCRSLHFLENNQTKPKKPKQQTTLIVRKHKKTAHIVNFSLSSLPRCLLIHFGNGNQHSQ